MTDKHYKAEVKELMTEFAAQGMSEDEAKAKAEAASPFVISCSLKRG